MLKENHLGNVTRNIDIGGLTYNLFC